MYKVFYGTLCFVVPLSITHAESRTFNVLPEIPAPQSLENKYTSQIKNVDTPLYLLVYLNNSNTSKIIEFFERNDETLYTSAEQLRQLRFKIDAKVSNDQFVSLSDISHLQYDYQIENQELHIKIPQERLNSYVIDLKSPEITQEELAQFKPLTSALINYAFYNTISNQKNFFNASFEGRLSTPYGNMSHNVVYRDKHNGYRQSESFTRLDSFWQYIDPVKIRSYTVGDFITHTPDWGNSLRLAGFQWSSAYQQRSDIITAALPQFSGSAFLPSTLDLFINQQKVYSGEVPSGPFDIKSLPYISGNEVTLVTKDITGQQIKSTQQYYYSQNLLSKGIKQFSVDIGIPRLNFGTSSNDYDSDVLMGTASLRKGLNNKLTLDSNIELSTDGLTQLGFGLTRSFFNRGLINLSGSHSQYKDQSGSLLLVGFESRLHEKFSLNSRYQKTFDNYHNLARVTDIRFKEKIQSNTFSQDYSDYSALAKEILQLGFSWKFTHGFNVSGNYHDLKTNNNQYRNASLSFGGRINRHLSFYGTSYKDLNQSENYGVYFSLIHNPSRKVSANASYRKDAKNSSYRLQLDTTNSQAIGDIGWGVSVEHNTHSNEQHAYLNYLARSAFISMDYSQSGQYHQTVLSATGALLATSGRVFATNQIGDSFAIVENAGPNSEIMNGGLNLGKADSKGRFLISSLTPYSKHTISLDPTNLPIGWIPENTQQNLITGYRQGSLIRFKTRESISATVILVDKNQQPLAPGYSVQVNNQLNSAMTGYGGETYIIDLKSQNKLIVDLLDEGSCHVEFSYTSNQATTQKLGPYVCN